MNNVIKMRRYPAKAAWGYYNPRWPLFADLDKITPHRQYGAMGEVINLFEPAENIEVSVNMENVTLEDVIQALYEKYDMTECTVCWRESDGTARMAGDISENDSVILLEDILEAEFEDGGS